LRGTVDNSVCWTGIDLGKEELGEEGGDGVEVLRDKH
jgi:hypothetical protein